MPIYIPELDDWIKEEDLKTVKKLIEEVEELKELNKKKKYIKKFPFFKVLKAKYNLTV